MEIRPIRSDADYRAALAAIDEIAASGIEPKEGKHEADRLDVLATLVQAYEAIHYPIEAPDPIEAIKFRMEQAGLTRRDLEPAIGGDGRVSEVLNRRRPLTLAMVRRLNAMFGIPAESLIRAYETTE